NTHHGRRIAGVPVVAAVRVPLRGALLQIVNFHGYFLQSFSCAQESMVNFWSSVSRVLVWIMAISWTGVFFLPTTSCRHSPRLTSNSSAVHVGSVFGASSAGFFCSALFSMTV